MTNGGLTLGQGVLVVAASLGVAAIVAFPEVIFGGSASDSLPAAGPSAISAYGSSVASYVEAVEAKYAGAVAADDAATIALSVCQSFELDPATAYSAFTAKAASMGMGAEEADYMARTAVQKVCPRHRSDLP